VNDLKWRLCCRECGQPFGVSGKIDEGNELHLVCPECFAESAEWWKRAFDKHPVVKGWDIASTSTCALSTDGNYLDITGTTRTKICDL